MDAPRPTSDRYGCTAGCRADAGAGLHNPDCRVPPPTTSELAADVREAMDAGGDFLYEPVGQDGIAALDALVARVTDLEAQVATMEGEAGL